MERRLRQEPAPGRRIASGESNNPGLALDTAGGVGCPYKV